MTHLKLPKKQFIQKSLLLIISVVTLLFGQGLIRVYAATACPPGMTQLDCDSLYGDWASWIPDTGSSACGAGATTVLVGGPADAELNLSSAQISVVNTIIGIAKTENLGQAGALIGLMTAEDESHFKIYANSNVPVSLQIPHQAVGSDHDSLGVFQQRISTGWSTISSNPSDSEADKQLMDPAYNAEAFFGSPPNTKAPGALSKGLQNVSGWQSLSPWLAAQKVQISFDKTGSNYKAFLGDAQKLIAKYYDSATAVPLPVPFTGAGTGITTSAANACAATSGVVAGNIVQTALGLAWPTGGNRGKEKSDATQAYQKAMPLAQCESKSGDIKVGCGLPADDPWSDCGIFVSTVMISSGADTDYPKRGTSSQLGTLKSEPSKYLDLGELSNSAQVQPGDIFISSGHTFLYIGKQPSIKSGDTVAEGSWHDHVPEVNTTLSSFGGNGTVYNNSVGEPFSTFRLKNQGAPVQPVVST